MCYNPVGLEHWEIFTKRRYTDIFILAISVIMMCCCMTACDSGRDNIEERDLTAGIKYSAGRDCSAWNFGRVNCGGAVFEDKLGKITIP